MEGSITVLIPLLVSLILTLYITPKFIVGLKREGYVAVDYYKKEKPELPNKAGVVVLFTVFMTFVLTPIIFRAINRIFIFDFLLPREPTLEELGILSLIAFFGFYGIMDDYVDIGRPAKILIPLLFSYPIVLVLTPFSLRFPFIDPISPDVSIVGGFYVSMLLKYMIVPLYVMVVANLVNMHSGFNGLQSGLSSIILVFILLKSIMDGKTEHIITIAALTGAVIGIWWYNKYPARIFEGNIGALATGGALGGAIIIQGYLVSGFIMLIPHIINFLMYAYWRAKRIILLKQGKKVGQYHKSIKFGKLRRDGTLFVPNRLTLKWLLPYHYRMTELQAVMVMYAVTLAFCAAGLFIPY